MANAPLGFCRAPKCSARVAGGYCPAHQRQAPTPRQRTDPRYGTQRWRHYSEQRKLTHPWCALCRAFCGGQDRHGRSLGVTDHIVPVVEAPDRFWDETNHRTLCVACNATAKAERTREARQWYR